MALVLRKLGEPVVNVNSAVVPGVDVSTAWSEKAAD